MASRFLLVDVSNSFTKYVTAGIDKLGTVHTHPTPEITLAWLKNLAAVNRENPVVLSSVVPRCTALFQRIFRDRLHRLHGEADLGLPIDYPNKKQIGPDRLANAMAARQLYGAPAVVIDFGTAVTFDVLHVHGAYAGGVIAPGLNVMTDYLHERTALLPKVALIEPVRMIGRSTEEAIRIGAIVGYRGLIREILRQLKKEMKTRRPLHVIATGGQAEMVTRGLPEVAIMNRLLTLEGLRIWAVYLQKRGVL